MTNTQYSVEVLPEMAGQRLDQALASLLPEFSRSRLSLWIKEGQVRVDGQVRRPRDKLLGGEQIIVMAVAEADERHQAEAIALDVVYEDASIIVLNKPAGLVVHPAAGNPAGTLLNALLHHASELAQVPRAGIVHRLDKDTSGLLVVARTLQAQNALAQALADREMLREYEAVVLGAMTGGGTVDAPLGRHPVDRKRMAVVASGRPAITHYRLAERFRAHTRLSVRLETGRTHQIRVHMAHIRHPIVGDPVYGGRLRLPAGASEDLREVLQQLRRQALHAARLGLHHPAPGDYMEWTAAAPDDMQRLMQALREDADAAAT
jgi:23S rRNA pseudouridine1911/1915/1917 synthase